MERRGLMKDKGGFQLAINTVVIMILAIMILLFLILFFTSSAGDFLGKIRGYLGYSNVDSVVKGCNLMVDSNQGYAYCCEKKSVKYYEEGKKVEGEFSCLELTNKSFGTDIDELDCSGVGC